MSGRHKTRRAIVALVALVALQGLAVLAYLAVEGHRQRQQATPFRYERVGPTPMLPRMSLVRDDGSRIASEELHGTPVLLHFWASWCAPCKAELPELLSFARSEPRLRVLAISLDDDWPEVRTFFHGTVPREVVRDPSGSLRQHYAVSALPDTYLVAASGQASLRFLGARAWSSNAAQAALSAHLPRAR